MPALNLPFLSRERERKPCEQGHSRGNEMSQGTRKDTAEQGSGGVARSRVVLRLASLTTRNGELASGWCILRNMHLGIKLIISTLKKPLFS